MRGADKKIAAREVLDETEGVVGLEMGMPAPLDVDVLTDLEEVRSRWNG